LKLLKEENERFAKDLGASRNLLQQVNATADGQYPFATTLNCMDPERWLNLYLTRDPAV